MIVSSRLIVTELYIYIREELRGLTGLPVSALGIQMGEGRKEGGRRSPMITLILLARKFAGRFNHYNISR